MNTNFKVIGLTQLEINPKSTAPEADALTTRPSELLMPAMPTSVTAPTLETNSDFNLSLCLSHVFLSSHLISSSAAL